MFSRLDVDNRPQLGFVSTLSWHLTSYKFEETGEPSMLSCSITMHSPSFLQSNQYQKPSWIYIPNFADPLQSSFVSMRGNVNVSFPKGFLLIICFPHQCLLHLVTDHHKMSLMYSF